MKNLTVIGITLCIVASLFYVAYLLGCLIGAIHPLAPYVILLPYQIYLAAQNRDNVAHIVGSIIGLLIIYAVPQAYACFMVGSMCVFPPLLYVMRRNKQEA